MRSDKFLQRLLGVVLSVGIAAVNSVSQSPRTVDAAELQLAMKRLTVVGSALYVAAHPDDENTALLSYLAKGRLVRAAYLSVTRGEGGQNLIGSEQGELLGIVRTQELLAARRYDGAEQFFTRAIDFGYSKSSEETIRIWDHEKILSDMVWIIRSFRPDVMITRFAPTLGGHGNHTASAIIAEAAFQAAGDPAKFPEQLKFVQPWQPKRVVFNAARFLTEQFDTSKAVTVDVGEYNPLLGKSYSEIAGISRSMHKSQGFGAGQNRGPQVNYFIHRVEEQAKADLFDSVDLTWSRVPGGKKVGALLEEASRTFQPHNPSASIHLLLQAYSEMAKLPADAWVTYKRSELLEVVKSCAGLWVDALASDYSAAPGTQVRVTASFIQRSNVSVTLERVGFPFSQSDTVLNRPLVNNVPMQIPSSISLPKEMQYTQPYWLQEKGSLGSYQVPEQRLVGLPENPAPLSINVAMLFDNVRVVFDVPIRYRWVDPVEGELYRPFEIVPPVAINLQERVYLFHNPDEKRVTVTLRSGGTNMRGEVRLIPPEGWSSRPSSIPFTLQRKGEELNVSFTVGVGSSTTNGSFRVEAIVGGRIVSHGMQIVNYKHIPPQTIFPAAEGKFVRLDLSMSGTNIGYIVGSGDEIPSALRQVGYNVALITDEDLASGDLSRFDAIIAGVRAYNTRPAIRNQQKRLLEYVEKGGTYLVQYVTQQRLESENLGPYPFDVSRDRVSVEEAPVLFLRPNHTLLNSPNKITPADFEGWVQERGLYFADKWDSKYETVIASNDPGEKPKEGGLLVARYGKGYFLYTGYAFFRQLPAGVPGACRLFVNLISLSKADSSH